VNVVKCKNVLGQTAKFSGIFILLKLYKRCTRFYDILPIYKVCVTLLTLLDQLLNVLFCHGYIMHYCVFVLYYRCIGAASRRKDVIRTCRNYFLRKVHSVHLCTVGSFVLYYRNIGEAPRRRHCCIVVYILIATLVGLGTRESV